MKINITYRFKAFLICAVFLGFVNHACTDRYEEMNKPNYQPIQGIDNDDDDDGPIVIEGDPGDFIFDFTYQGIVDDHQRTTSLFHDLYSHYFANNKFSTSNYYLYDDNWMKLRWEHFYVDRFQEFKNINKVCLQDKDGYFRNAYHIAWINYYLLTSLTTDTYGPIPCTSVIENMKYELANNVVVDKPVIYYDTQEQVYDRMFKRLAVHQDSILPFDVEEELYRYNERENIYNGDPLKWKKFANSLRLRLAMRISNIDPVRSRQEAEAAIAAGLMQSNDDNYAVHYNWPNGHENDYALAGFLYGDVVMSKDLENMYKLQSTQLDPRCPISWYRNFTPHSDVLKFREAPFGDYVGAENGAENVIHHDMRYSYLKSKMGERNDQFWYDYNRPMEVLNYAEVCFLMAEASLRGYAGAGKSPKEYYLDGIRASMDYHSIPRLETETYIFTLQNDPFDGSDKEAILEQIINQKWLAIFPNGPEGWADFRRTDYPVLSQIVSNRSGDIEQGKFIKRINYPVSEHDLNEENVYYPFSSDSKGQRLWWDVMDTHSGSFTRNMPNNFR